MEHFSRQRVNPAIYTNIRTYLFMYIYVYICVCVYIYIRVTPN